MTKKSHDKYFDTSVVRMILMGTDVGKKILSDLNCYSGKNLISDHVKYEFKRAVLCPIWELHWSIQGLPTVNLAILNGAQDFSIRKVKALLAIVSQMTGGTDVPGPVFQSQLIDLAKKLENDLDNVFETIANKTGCKLADIEFKVDEDYPTLIKCFANCNVDNYWKGKKSYINKLQQNTYTGKEEKEWYANMTTDLVALNADFSYGKNEKHCMKLSDILIYLYPKKTRMVLLSLDKSFQAINSILAQDFHKISSLTASVGGTNSTVAKKAFNASKGIVASATTPKTRPAKPLTPKKVIKKK